MNEQQNSKPPEGAYPSGSASPQAGASIEKQPSRVKAHLKALKDSMKDKKFAEGDENMKKIGEALDKMNFDEDEKEESEEENSEPEENSDSPVEQKESGEHMEQIQAILPKLDEEKLEMALGFLNAILEGKEPPMAMQEKKPLDQSKAKMNPINAGPAKFGETARRIPTWQKQMFGELSKEIETTRKVAKELQNELSALKNEKKAQAEKTQAQTKFQEELEASLKGNPYRESLQDSLMQTFSEKGIVVAREALKASLGVATKISTPNVKLPKPLVGNFSQPSPEQIPELKKYVGNQAHLKKAMEFAENYRSRSGHTMSFEAFIDNGMKAEFAELRGPVRGVQTFTETVKE